MHKAVVVEVVVVMVVVVMVVVVVDATHESHAIGQIDLRAGNCSHWLGDVTSSQSGDGSGVRSGSTPLHRSHTVPDHG